MSDVTSEKIVGYVKKPLPRPAGRPSPPHSSFSVIDTGLDHDLHPLGTIGDRPHVRQRIKRGADPDGARSGTCKSFHFAEPMSGHEHARRRTARLADIAHAGEHALRDRLGEVCVVEQNVRRLAAELLNHAFHGRCGSLRDEYPARVEPVIEIMSTSGWLASAAPTLSPVPLTRLNTPAGMPASCINSAKSRAL